VIGNEKVRNARSRIKDWDKVNRYVGLLLFSFVSLSAGAFDVDGYRSGMSLPELAAATGRFGWTLAQLNDAPNLYGEVHVDKNGHAIGQEGPGRFIVCHGKLESYFVSIDFDADYATSLRDLLARYGQPTVVMVNRSPWNGPGGGYLTSVDTEWKTAGDFITLSFQPETRLGSGALKNGRGANVSYSTGACS